MKWDLLTTKKSALDVLRPFPPELVKNLDDWFRVELTFTSNAIEGNTLTRRETAIVIEKGLAIGGKSLKEHLEATNHAKALDYIYFHDIGDESIHAANSSLQLHLQSLTQPGNFLHAFCSLERRNAYGEQ